MAAVAVVVANPDDAAEVNCGNGAVEPCICHVQLGRAGELTAGLLSADLSCVRDTYKVLRTFHQVI